jgi:ABC-type nitrate/sulfonate/bicarbonate transport system substrate-binding protein
VNLYGNAILASNAMVTQSPGVVAAFLRATTRALQETLANPLPAMAAIKQREPILDEKLELERWRLTAQYVAAADTRSHGLGDVRKYLLEQQVDQVTEVFGLKTRPSAEGIFNRAMLPSVAERTLKA